jgi:N-acetylmuramoyl-L-alanine amidase
MIAIPWYLAKVIICSSILLCYYWLALRNKAFHHYNRFYLLATVMLSILLPFVQINFWHSNAESNNAIKVIEAVSYGNTYVNDIVINSAPIQNTFNWQLPYPIAYLLVSILLSIGFIKMLFQIRTLLKKYPTQKIEKVTFVNTDNEKGTPFSFLKYIFWNNQINTSTAQGNQIFKHELAHINEKHTYDKLFINIVLIVFWCNPFFWLLHKEINLLHEFIADEKAVEDGDTSAFAAMLLQTIYPQHQFSIVNNFFYSPIKRRLLMLTKIKNPKANYFGRILVLPLTVFVLAAFTFKVNKHTNHLYNGKKITVVIDAGHGGEKDPGASNNGVYEKDINLALAKFIKSYNSNDAINIVLSRDEDVYQPVTEKVKIVNELGAELYITLHVDKATKANTQSGINFFVSKNEYPNSKKSKVFATSLINEFVSNYPLTVSTTPLQRQVGIWVLQNVTAPSVLIEAGFINNDRDAAYLQSLEGKETIAKNILIGIENFLAQPPLITTNTDTIPNKLPTKAQWEKAVDKKPTNDLKPTSSVTISALNDKIDFYSDNKNALPTKDNPLFVLDGVEITKSELDKLDPTKIESIDVLKGENVPAYYGEKGKNGVIKITTKNKSTIRLNSPISVTNLKSNTVPDMLYIVNGLQVNKEEVGKIKTDDIIDVRVLQAKEAIPTYGDKAQNGVMIFNVKEEKKIFVETVDLDADAKNVGKNPYVEVDGKPFNDEFKTIPKQILKSIKIIGKNEAVKIYGDKGKDGAILVTTK